MAAKNLSPRQKMIGMMYLVLTALLALNVSKDILDAFVIVNSSLERTRQNLSERTQVQYSEFELARSVDPKRIAEAWMKAQKTKKLSEEVVAYIDSVKKKLIAESESVDKKTADTLKLANVEKKDEYDIPTYIMIGELEDGSKGVARQIKNKLNYFRDQLVSFIFPEDRKKIDLGISTNDPPKNENNENWELHNFYHTPLAASITILSKLQNDAKNAESIVLDYLLKKNDVKILKFDTIAPKIIPQSNYVLLGEEYKADVFIAAFNKTQNPVVMAGSISGGSDSASGLASLPVDKGIGRYTFKTGREGLMQWGGTISMKTPRGETVTYPFKSEFIVAKPSMTVSADKMNVFYKGVENPVSISVPGVPNERVKVSISTGNIRRVGDGKYVVTGVNGTKAFVNVTASLENGETREMGKSEFRVKPLPDPYALFAGMKGGKLKRNLLPIHTYLKAEFDKYFEFGFPIKVETFKMEAKIKGILSETLNSDGQMLTERMMRIIKNLQRGDKIYFYDIYTTLPDGTRRKLSDITIDVE